MSGFSIKVSVFTKRTFSVVFKSTLKESPGTPVRAPDPPSLSKPIFGQLQNWGYEFLRIIFVKTGPKANKKMSKKMSKKVHS
jgi:hypothetical protein